MLNMERMMKPSFAISNDKEILHIKVQDHSASSVVIETPLQHWSKLHTEFLMSRHVNPIIFHQDN